MIRWLAVLIVLSQISERAVPPQRASIAGVVFRSGGSKESLDDARIELSGLIGQNPGPSVRRAVMTGKDGRFVFEDLDAGAYVLTITSNGYVRQIYPLRSRFNLAAGQKLTGISVALTPTGSVSGRIRDRGGEPAAGVPVQLLKYTYDDIGRRKLTAFGPSASDRTDDRGEYRLFYITPGTYYLYVGNPWTNPSSDWREESRRQTFSYAFYPGVADSGSATPIVVQAGSDIRGIDVMLERQPPYRISGRIIDSKTGRPPVSPNVQLYLNGSSLDPQYNREYLGGEKANYKDGVFEFRNVLPGSFSVTVFVWDRDREETECDACPQRAAFLPVNVVNADISNLFLSIPTSSSMRGRWRSEKQPPTQNRLFIGFAPSADGPLAPLLGSYRYEATLNADGTVTGDNVAPGNYRINARSLPSGFYVKEARFGGQDALARPFNFTGDQAGSLDIVLGVTSAAVEGIAIDERLQPVAYATVVLAPSKNRDRPDLFRTATTGADGRFTLANVTPGDYRVFAWDAIESNAYFDPELLRQSEAKSVSVSLSESSRRNISIRVEFRERL